MFGLTTATSGSGALPPTGQQVRLQQSRQAAERAEQVARDLRQQADAAQQDADRSQSTARSLGTKADQAELQADQLRQGRPVFDRKPIVSTADGPTNLYGQRLGQYVNVTA